MEIPEFKFAVREDLKNCEINFLPYRATDKSTGWDVKAAFEDKKPLHLYPFQYALIPLGFRAFCPEDWWYELKPRSSTFAKKKLHCLYGTIDEDYDKQLLLAVQYIPDGTSLKNNALIIQFGDALGQIIPVKRQEMIITEISNENFDKLCKKRNGNRIGGFGSTSS